jgi:hypothetical protein
VEAKEDFKNRAGGVSEADFEKHGQSAVRGGVKYYHRLYNTEGGELFELKKSSNAASIFDPRILKGTALPVAMILCDGLKKFGFKQFTPSFIQNLKNELPRLKELADQEYDWNSVEGAAAYISEAKCASRERSQSRLQ